MEVKILKTKWRTSLGLRRCLIDIGGHPRCFEYLILHCLEELQQVKSLDNLDFVEVIRKTYNKISLLYGTVLYKDLKWLCILQRPVEKLNKAQGFKLVTKNSVKLIDFYLFNFRLTKHYMNVG